VRRALERNPGSGFVNFMAGATLVFAGDPQDALVRIERAMALGPLDPSFYMYLMVAGWSHLFSGHPAEALELAERSASLNPDWDSIYWGLIPAYVQLDRLPEARAALIKYLSLAPGTTVSGLRQLLPIRNQASLEMVLDGLRKAGLPD
jgi:Flp pilus assembly protein TadD